MSAIERNLRQAASTPYDLIIVGAGIYGVSLALMAALNGRKALIIDRSDFGAETTFNSLRIVHGGLRYLQKLDIPRFFESVNERRWFFRNFPNLVEPIPCMMPLYGKGLKRPAVFGPALKINDFLSRNRNKGVIPEVHLPNGKLVSNKEVVAIFPSVDQQGLKGGAVWYDGSMPDSQLIVMEILKKACELGSTAINYCEATDLIIKEGNITGLTAKDSETGEQVQFKSNHVVNMAGPWCRALAGSLDKDYPQLFHRSLATNLLLDRDQISSHALAITPKVPSAKTYFLRPFKGKLFAGTIHESCTEDHKDARPSAEGLQHFLDNLNLAIPDLKLTPKDIIRVYGGYLPAKEKLSHEIAVRDVIIDHSKNNGPKGLLSVSGVKFTTARHVAGKALKAIFPELASVELQQNLPGNKHGLPPVTAISSFESDLSDLPENLSEKALDIANKESVMHIDDLLYRRSSIGDNPKRAEEAANQMLPKLTDEANIPDEMNRVRKHFKS